MLVRSQAQFIRMLAQAFFLAFSYLAAHVESLASIG
jgi:hypothetical protein